MTSIEHIRSVMFRASPLSEDEKQAFIQYSERLKRQLDEIEKQLEQAGKSTESLQNLRHLLDSIPGISI